MSEPSVTREDVEDVMGRMAVLLRYASLQLEARPHIDPKAGPTYYSIIADRLATLEAECDRYKLKCEQYQRQLDDKWEGVTALTNKALADVATLERERDAVGQRVVAALQWEATDDGPLCRLCAKPWNLPHEDGCDALAILAALTPAAPTGGAVNG